MKWRFSNVTILCAVKLNHKKKPANGEPLIQYGALIPKPQHPTMHRVLARPRFAVLLAKG